MGKTGEGFDFRIMVAKALGLGAVAGLASQATQAVAAHGVSFDAASGMLQVDLRTFGVFLMTAAWGAYRNWTKNRERA